MELDEYDHAISRTTNVKSDISERLEQIDSRLSIHQSCGISFEIRGNSKWAISIICQPYDESYCKTKLVSFDDYGHFVIDYKSEWGYGWGDDKDFENVDELLKHLTNMAGWLVADEKDYEEDDEFF